MAWTLTFFGWPKELEPRTWQKANKNGELTDLLSDLATAKNQHAGIGNYPLIPAKANRHKADEWVRNAIDVFQGKPMKQLVGALRVIEKRCDGLEKTKLSSDAKTAVKAIKKSCDQHADSVDMKVVLPALHAAADDLVEADKQYVLQSLRTLFASLKACAQRGHPGVQKAKAVLQAWPADPAAEDHTRQEIGNALYGDCRDMTQNVQNMVKAINYGADLTQFGFQDGDVAALPKLARSLVPIANAKSGVANGLSRAQAATLVRAVDVNAKLFDQIAGRAP